MDPLPPPQDFTRSQLTQRADTRPATREASALCGAAADGTKDDTQCWGTAATHPGWPLRPAREHRTPGPALGEDRELLPLTGRPVHSSSPPSSDTSTGGSGGTGHQMARASPTGDIQPPRTANTRTTSQVLGATVPHRSQAASETRELCFAISPGQALKACSPNGQEVPEQPTRSLDSPQQGCKAPGRDDWGAACRPHSSSHFLEEPVPTCQPKAPPDSLPCLLLLPCTPVLYVLMMHIKPSSLHSKGNVLLPQAAEGPVPCSSAERPGEH